MKENKKRSLKRDLYIIRYILSKTNEYSRSYLLLLTLSIFVRAVQPLSYIIFPRFIIDELTGQQSIEKLALIILLFAGTVFIADISNMILESSLNIRNERIFINLELELGKKAISMDYEYLEKPDIQDLKNKAIEGMRSYGGMWGLGNELINIVSGTITMLTLVYIIGNLNLAVIILLVLVIALNTYLNNTLQEIVYKFWDALMGINRRFRYMTSLMLDFKYGKDIRLYNMKNIMGEKNSRYQSETFELYTRQVKREQVYLRYKALVAQIQRGVVNAFLAYKAFWGIITLGEFTMYAAAANTLVDTFGRMTNSVVTIRRFCQYFESYVEFNELRPVKVQGCLPASKDTELAIEFRNVSFKYPGSDKYVLQNLNIRLEPNKRLSIVGMNGAGKTTFIKLLTRLYDPTEGEILLNGVNIKEYSYDEYLSLFAVVFQDFGLVAASVAENIAPSGISLGKVKTQTENDRLYDALNKAGLTERVDSIKDGLNTQVYKIFNEDGVEFSGGEAQKLAIARAVYKDSPFVILDEPTAALDPIAEYGIYHHFDQLIGNKTTVYISHRLSSCRFCDSIAVFHKGEIVEQGNHDKLILNTAGKYYEMFTAQAQYYTDSKMPA